jgi:hypothetical protein
VAEAPGTAASIAAHPRASDSPRATRRAASAVASCRAHLSRARAEAAGAEQEHECDSGQRDGELGDDRSALVAEPAAGHATVNARRMRSVRMPRTSSPAHDDDEESGERDGRHLWRSRTRRWQRRCRRRKDGRRGGG